MGWAARANWANGVVLGERGRNTPKREPHTSQAIPLGPCLEAFRKGEPFVVVDFSDRSYAVNTKTGQIYRRPKHGN